jgi:hypothetical protein
MLSAQQVQHYETFGFLLLRQWLSPADAARFAADAEGIMSPHRVGPVTARGGRHAVAPLWETVPAMHHWLEDDRFYGVACDPGHLLTSLTRGPGGPT